MQLRIALTAGFMGLAGILTAAPAMAAPPSTIACSDPCVIFHPGYFPRAVDAWVTLPNQVGAIPLKVANDALGVPGKVTTQVVGLPGKVTSDIVGIPGKVTGGILGIPGKIASDIAGLPGKVGLATPPTAP